MEQYEESHRFDHIINLPHHVSKVRTPMSMWSRAAQFSPFAALTGYDEAVKETARLTTERMEIDEDTRQKLDLRFHMLQEQLDQKPEIQFTYFVPDEKKAGGEYITRKAIVKKIDRYQRVMILTDGIRIPINEIIDMEGEIFSSLESI